MSRAKFPPEKRPCTICGAYKPLEALSKAYYESTAGHKCGSGELCSRCVADLPPLVLGRDEAYLLTVKAI